MTAVIMKTMTSRRSSLLFWMLLVAPQALAFSRARKVSFLETTYLCYHQAKDSSTDDTESSLAVRPDNVLAMPTQELWSQEWHDSFVRNGLVDFVPPLTEHLDCLLLGQGLRTSSRQLPGDAYVNELQLESDVATHQVGSMERAVKQATSGVHPSTSSLMELLLHNDQLLKPTMDPPQYDCILDRGLMNELLHSSPGKEADVGLLLLEATRRIREHGVYVLITRPGALSSTMKEFLVDMGIVLGLQWRFDLDGISDDEINVTVARRYFTGELPPVGRLAARIPMPHP